MHPYQRLVSVLIRSDVYKALRKTALPRSSGRFLFWIVALVGVLFSLAGTLPRPTRASLGALPGVVNQKRRRTDFVPGRVLVRYKDESLAKRHQVGTKALSIAGRSVPLRIERFEGSDIVAGLRLGRVTAADTLQVIQALRHDPDVRYAYPDYLLHSDLTPDDPQFGQLYGLTKIGAPAAWDTNTGNSNVVVAVIDEGIDIAHQDLMANIWTNPSPGAIPGFSGDLHGYDFVNNSGTIPAEFHGSHVAGTIGAVGNNSVGVVGVNWNVSLMSLRFLAPGGGSDSDAIRAISYAKQMKDLWVSSGGTQGANVRVLNNSYSGGSFNQAFQDTINAAGLSGILFVAAASNEGTNNDTFPRFPANYDAPNVVTVAATDSADALAGFSNFGADSVAIGAPGVGILSTTPGNTYSFLNGTSMASPHAAGAAALLLAQNPGLTLQQLKSALIFNGDLVASLSGKTITGRRLNVANSLAALAENDTTPPGAATNFHVNTQSGRSFNLGWTAAGDDGAAGQASLYQVSFIDAMSGTVFPLKKILPPASGAVQTLDIKTPYRHTQGTITLREFDNVGNEGTPVTIAAAIGVADADPYLSNLSPAVPLSTGGTPLGLTFDDRYLENYTLPFVFPFFGQGFHAVTISTNGSLYFSAPPKRANGDADDVPSSTVQLNKFKMIAGLWDDLYLGTDQRADADVYVVQPDANTIIFRWQGVPCNPGTNGCVFGGAPINFEIELRSNGQLQTRYGSGNANLFPVVGISGGEPDAYVVPSHTSPDAPLSLTNAQRVTFALQVPTATTGTISGKVLRDDQGSLAGVAVMLSGAHPRKTITDANGYYQFDNLETNSFYTITPLRANFTFSPFNRSFSQLGDKTEAAFTGSSFGDSANPLDTAEYFVRQQYVDVLNREPDEGGFNYWSDQILACGGDQQCLSTRRRDVAAAFFIEQEAQQTASYIYDCYAAALGRRPAFSEYKGDRQQVTGGANLDAAKTGFARSFVQRPEFVSRYSKAVTAETFVDAVIHNVQSATVDLSGDRAILIAAYNASSTRIEDSRAAVLKAIADNATFKKSQFNQAFVLTEYFAYLQRDADAEGYDFWVNTLTNSGGDDLHNYRGMVCSFITSREYQLRFSAIVTRSNSECAGR
jgi:subtilisin family serine protease